MILSNFVKKKKYLPNLLPSKPYMPDSFSPLEMLFFTSNTICERIKDWLTD